MARIYFPDELTPFEEALLEGASEGDTVVFSICYGGDLATAIKLADVIREKRLNTEARYIVASAAVLCYCAGINRYALPEAKFLLHEAVIPLYTETNVNETDLRSEAEAMRQYNEIIISRISDYTGANTTTIEQMMRANGGEGTWLNVDDAIGLGFITEIIKPSREAALIANFINGGSGMAEHHNTPQPVSAESVEPVNANGTEKAPAETQSISSVEEIFNKISALLDALTARIDNLEKKQIEFVEKIENEIKKPVARIGSVDASIVDKKIENKPSGKIVDYYREKFERLLNQS